MGISESNLRNVKSKETMAEFMDDLSYDMPGDLDMVVFLEGIKEEIKHRPDTMSLNPSWQEMAHILQAGLARALKKR